MDIWDWIGVLIAVLGLIFEVWLLWQCVLMGSPGA